LLLLLLDEIEREESQVAAAAAGPTLMSVIPHLSPRRCNNRHQ